MSIVVAVEALRAARRLCAAAQPSAADLEDGLRYINDTTEAEERYGRLLEMGDLRFRGIVMMDPTDFIEDASHFEMEPGALQELPRDEWLEALHDAYSREFDHTLAAYEAGEVAPAIQIDGQMADGRGRAFFFHALGEQMPVAQYDLDLDDDGRLAEAAFTVEFKVKHGRVPEGEVSVRKDGKKVAFLRFHPDDGGHSQMVHAESIKVVNAQQRQGLGTMILERFKGWLNTTYPNVLYYSSDATSRGSLKLTTKVFGRPLYVDDNIDSFDYEGAMKRLKHDSGRLDERDMIIADDYVRAIHWIGRGKPKTNPWKNA